MTIERKRFYFGRFILLIIAVALLGVGLFVFDPLGWRDPADNTEVSAEESVDHSFKIKDGVLTDIPSDAHVTVPEGVTDISLSSDTVEELILPDSIEKISDLYCPALKSLTMPNSITSLDVRALSSCTKLESVILSENLSKIPYGAFVGCSKLKSITIPKKVKIIESRAFSGCSSLTEIHVAEEGVLYSMNAFEDCEQLKKEQLRSMQPRWQNVFDKLDYETTNPPTVYRSSSDLGFVGGNITSDYDSFPREMFYGITKTNANPIAIIEQLVDKHYLTKSKSEAGANSWSYRLNYDTSDPDNKLKDLSENIKPGIAATGHTYPYNEEGCLNAISEILPSYYNAFFSEYVPYLYYSEKDQCYYCYLIFTDDYSATHCINFYFRSSDRKVIDDLTIEFLVSADYSCVGAGASLTAAMDERRIFVLGERTLLSANLCMTGLDGAKNLNMTATNNSTVQVTCPRTQKLGNYTVKTDLCRLAANNEFLFKNYGSDDPSSYLIKTSFAHSVLFTTHIHR